jgi:dynein heavy chain
MHCHAYRREELVSSWVAKCQALAIPVSQNCTLRGTLASPVEVREWLLAGLPSDGTSIDNSILVTRGKRWPLMIDPQVRVAISHITVPKLLAAHHG